MKQTFFSCLLITLSALAFGQTGKLTGSIMDAATKTPLELATVTVLGPDSAVLAYELSDKNGLFTFDKLPLRKKLLVNITYTGYIAYHTSIQQDTARTDTLSVLLALSSSDTVVVTAAIPIRMNGDTLEINPAAFKMKNEAVVEELLNQVSGITIWSDGSITVDGKKVQNLLVDGKPFMGATDPRIATQNLPKSAIDKIQLYQEYDRSKIGQQAQPQDSLLTMNLKLKESSKKGYFGKAGAGYGTRDRFEGDLSFQLYNKRSSAGIGGGINNINKNIGNLQEMFQNNTYRNYNPNLYNVGRFGANGINKNHSIGGVLTHNFIESANSRQNDRITLNYNKSGVDAFITDKTYTTRTTVDNPQFIRDEGEQNNRNDRHEVGINYVKTNSYNDNLNINGVLNTSRDNGNSFRTTEVRDSANQLQSTNRITSWSSGKSDNELLNISFGKRKEEQPLQNFNGRIGISRGNTVSERNVISDFESMTDSRKNAFNDRLYTNKNQRLNITGALDYRGFKRLLLGRYNLFGIDLGFDQWFNYTRTTDDAVVSDLDTIAKQRNINQKLSNANKRELIEYTPALTMAKNFSRNLEGGYRNINLQFKLLEDIKIDKNSSSIAQRNLDRSFNLLRYEGSIGYQKYHWEKYQYNASVNYTKSFFEYPSIDRLYTIIDDINAYDIRIGNPNLRNSINHAISINGYFNTQNRKSPYSINGNFNGSYNVSLDPVTDSIINDPSGKRINYYVNAGKSSNINFNYYFNISRKIDKHNLQLMYSGNFRTGKQPNYIDGFNNISTTDNVYNNFTLQFTLNSRLVFTAGQSFQNNRSTPSAPGLKAFKNNNSTAKLGITVNLPFDFTISSTADRVSNSNINKPFVLWNSFATYRFMQQQGELKFSAMDLLKKYQNISNSVYAYGTSTRISNGLQQYFLLTFSYYPRKFGKAEIKSRQGN
ncbi:outer membrane beta-barrel protein [Paraflavitalea sp. CAU 1676]|uniref:outer membrane beta-barrel protein n=1 Tax=Paraflavitalea sp. CAU 1676 TaxID=3032598 RepID=UPI0023DB7C31|nr:outer membrane beta-barrel protein [Paraflavitalea sp. CAU 1676]MDF2192687.1 outer membrane beta-barrel protein [Paraflavitalea sp. CAU 1676]